MLKNKTYIGIVGSRRRDKPEDFLKVKNAFWGYIDARVPVIHLDDVVIVSGGCKKGGDKFAEEIYKFYHPVSKIDFIEHLPQLPDYYEQLSGREKTWVYAKAAYARNKLIARDSTHVLIACVSEDRTGGTENTIEWFRKYNKNGARKLILV